VVEVVELQVLVEVVVVSTKAAVEVALGLLHQAAQEALVY
jgi:hypothetical protein